MLRQSRVLANPTGMTVVSGSATAQQLGSQLNVTVSQAAVLNWQSFNISAGETTSFLQPSVNSVVLNIIGGANPSQIFGSLKANGTVILENASGFYFASGSMISVGGSFIATTAALPPDFGLGAAWQFSGPPPSAKIINYGQIQVGTGKSLFLIAEDIENYGTLNAPGGSVDLAAGQNVLVSDSPDGRGLSAVVTLPKGTVDNFGRITADGGEIMMQAQVVNQGGVAQADSVKNVNGVIELLASDTLNLEAGSQILARGDDAAGGSAGGDITLKAGKLFTDTDSSQVLATGGAHGGNGGKIEISAPTIQSLDSTLDATAQAGYVGGTFLLDPVNIILGTSTAGGAINVNKAFSKFTTIDLEATGNITLNAGTLWNLSKSTSENAGRLIMEAGGNITFGNNSGITDANDWSVSLYAGVTRFSPTAPTVQSGTGNIYLNGGSGANLNGYIQTAQGSISLEAGMSILTGKGYVVTSGGGNIYADALSGDITTGTTQVGNNNTGYSFNNNNDTYTVSAIYGGMGTYDGGNLTLLAGDSINPIGANKINYGVAGAFGSAPGDVTLVAGNQINGTFNVANGTGNLLAGVSVNGGQVTTLDADGSIGTSVLPVTLGLIGGTHGAAWNLWAADNINLMEIRNPEGSSDANALTTSGLFDYAATAAANLWAGNGITLGSTTTSLSGNGASEQTAVYCPILDLTAGAGGITIYNSIILYPSSQGALKISDGGDLTMAGQANPAPSLLMSDSTLTDYGDFSSHASTPLHISDGNPVTVAVAGNIYGLDLIVPTFADITVGGSTYNFGFTGQNLSPSQTTAINVTGNINYPTTLYSASVLLADALPASVLMALDASGDLGSSTTLTQVGSSLSINGQMSASALGFLLAPGEGLDAAQRAAVETLYAESQKPAGLALDGPGGFNITAHNISLGLSSGINADFPSAPDAALTAISPDGATLNITAGGNVDLTATEIANGGLGGGINLSVGGTLDVGGTATVLGSQGAPKGIFTTSGGDVNVTAVDNVNVDGSRIAAYNGGNVNITSQEGNVNAGAGGQGYVIFQSLQLDPVTGLLTAYQSTIPFSGILATTVFGSDAELGNITINAPNGSVNSSAGGILQIAFNNANTIGNTVNITAGKDINATGSGVIGYNVSLQAGGNINGVVVGSQSVAVTSQQSVDVTAVSGGNVNISASGSVSGTVIGGGDVSVSGSSIDAAVRGGSVSTSGDASGATVGTPSAGAAQNVQVADNADTVGSQTSANEEDDLKKKKAIALAQKVSRVTVLLPGQH